MTMTIIKKGVNMDELMLAILYPESYARDILCELTIYKNQNEVDLQATSDNIERYSRHVCFLA